jgi:hypothetical protein
MAIPTDKVTDIKAGMDASTEAIDRTAAATDRVRRTLQGATREFENLRKAIDPAGAALERLLNRQEQINRLYAAGNAPQTQDAELKARIYDIMAAKIAKAREEVEKFQAAVRASTVDSKVLEEIARRAAAPGIAAANQAAINKNLGVRAAPSDADRASREADLTAWNKLFTVQEKINAALAEEVRLRNQAAVVASIVAERDVKRLTEMAQQTANRFAGVTNSPTADDHAARQADLEAWNKLFTTQEKINAALQEEIRLRNQAAEVAKQAATDAYQSSLNQRLGVTSAPSAEDSAKRNADIQAYGAALDAERARYDSVFRVSKEYEAEVDRITAAREKGAISVTTQAEAMDRLNATYMAANDPLREQIALQKQAEAEAQKLAAAQQRQAEQSAKLNEQTRRANDPVYRRSKEYEEQLTSITNNWAPPGAYQRMLDDLNNKFRAANDPMIQFKKNQDEINRAQAEAAANLAATRAELVPMERATQAYNATLMKAREALDAGHISQTEHDAAVQHAQASLARQGTQITQNKKANDEFFGSTRAVTWAMRDMGLQSIDVIQGLATGQPIFTTLIQQGGQVYQVMQNMGVSFRQVGSALASMFARLLNPWTLFTAGTIAAGAAMIAAVSHATTLEAEHRALATTIESVGRTAELSAVSLQKYVIELDRAGATRAEAAQSVNQLARSGLTQGQIGAAVAIIPDAAVALNKSYADTTTLIADAANGSYDAIKKLDDQLNFLTATQLEGIKADLGRGDRVKALNVAFGELGNRVDGVRSRSLSDMQKAFEQLSNGWQDFMDRVARSGPVQTTMSILARTMGAIGDVLRDPTTSELTKQLDAQKQLLVELQRQYDSLSGRWKSLTVGQDVKHQIDQVTTSLKTLQDQIDATTKKAQANLTPAQIATGLSEGIDPRKVAEQEKALSDLTVAQKEELRVLAADVTQRDLVKASIEAEKIARAGSLSGARAEEAQTIARTVALKRFTDQLDLETAAMQRSIEASKVAIELIERRASPLETARVLAEQAARDKLASTIGGSPVSVQNPTINPSAQSVVDMIRAEADRQNVGKMASDFAVALANWETRGNFNHFTGSDVTTSPRGAKGLFQLTDPTARGLGVDATILPQNIKGGVEYAAQLLKVFGDLVPATMAWNMGPTATSQLLSKEIKDLKGIPDETVKFVEATTGVTRDFLLEKLKAYQVVKKAGDEAIEKERVNIANINAQTAREIEARQRLLTAPQNKQIEEAARNKAVDLNRQLSNAPGSPEAEKVVQEQIAIALREATKEYDNQSDAILRQGRAAEQMVVANNKGRAAIIVATAAIQAHEEASTKDAVQEAKRTRELINQAAAQEAINASKTFQGLDEQIENLTRLATASDESSRHALEIQNSVADATRVWRAYAEVVTDPAIKKATQDNIALMEKTIPLVEQRRGATAVNDAVIAAKAETEAQLRLNAAWDGSAQSLSHLQNEAKAYAVVIKTSATPGTKEFNVEVARITTELDRGTEAIKEFNYRQSSIQMISDALSTAFDRLGQSMVDAFVSGSGQAVNFGNILRGLASSLLSTLAQMALLNPILNAVGLTGSGGALRPTLSGIFSGGGASSPTSQGSPLIGMAGNASSAVSLTDALGLTNIGGYVKSALGFGEGGIFSNVGNSITGFLAQGIGGTSTTEAAAALAQASAAAEVGGVAAAGQGAGTAATGLFGGASIGSLASGIGGGFAAGSLVGSLVQGAAGKTGPGPTIGAGAGAAAGTGIGLALGAAGAIPTGGLSLIIAGLLGGILGGGAGGLIGPKPPSKFSAIPLSITDGRLGLGMPVGQGVSKEEFTQEITDALAAHDALNAYLATAKATLVSIGVSTQVGQNTPGKTPDPSKAANVQSIFSDFRFSSPNPIVNSAISSRRICQHRRVAGCSGFAHVLRHVAVDQ